MEKKIRPDTPTEENPEWTEEMFRQARKGSDLLGELGIAVPALRGRPRIEKPKKQVTLRLDADVLEHFKSGGDGWQTRINDALASRITRKAATARVTEKSGRSSGKRKKLA